MDKTLFGAIVVQTVRDYITWALEEHENKHITNLMETVEYLEKEINTPYFEGILQQLDDYENETVKGFINKLRRRTNDLIASGITSKAWKMQLAKLTASEKGANI